MDGRFAGWGGLQPENGEADLGLVLHPHFWGLGKAICAEIVRRAFEDMGMKTLTVFLPPSRMRIRGMLRLGFYRDGDLTIGTERFLRFRLDKPPRQQVGDAG